MTVNQFIYQNRINPIDAIVMRKKLFGMVDHYVIYLGILDNEHKFIANYIDGVKIIPNHKLSEFLSLLVPEKIYKFNGSDYERKKAFQRAISRIGERRYDYLANNCEHFKNWVHFGNNYSDQVNNSGGFFALSGVALTGLGASENDDNKIAIGLGLTALGLIMRALSGRNK